MHHSALAFDLLQGLAVLGEALDGIVDELAQGEPGSSISLFRTAPGRVANLEATYRQPFDLLTVAAREDQERLLAGVPAQRRFENWLPSRTRTYNPPVNSRMLYH